MLRKPLCFDVLGNWTKRLLLCGGGSLPCGKFLNVRWLGSQSKVRLRSRWVKVCSRARVFFVIRIAQLHPYYPTLRMIDYLRTARDIRCSSLRHYLGKLCHPHLHHTLVILKLLLAYCLHFSGFSGDVSHPDSLLAVLGMSIFEFLEPIFELLDIHLIFTCGKQFWLLHFGGLE